MTEPAGALPESAGALPEIDRLVHEPARLVILTVLAACEQADFLFLERATGLSRGNLSVQLGRLEETGLIRITKTIQRKRTLTMVALADPGRLALGAYWRVMAALRERAERAAEPAQVPSRLPLPAPAAG